MKKRSVYVLCHQGLGDHLLCLGMYRYLSQEFEKCVLPVTQGYYKSIKYLVRDLPNIFVVPFRFGIRDARLLFRMETLGESLACANYEVIRLGYFEKSFFKNPPMRLDEYFYHQAGIPLRYRWSYFQFERNLSKELELFELLVGKESEYVFMHEDKARGFLIKENRVQSKLKIVRPDPLLAGKYFISDYALIIEKATEIHCIESSFAALIEGMQVPTPKFAHRYARPEAREDYRHEFTYKTDWQILL